MLPKPIKPSKINPVGRGSIYIKNARIDLKTGLPVEQDEHSESIDKEKLFQDIIERYQRKINRLLDLHHKRWIASYRMSKPYWKKVSLWNKVLFLPKFILFKLDIFLTKWKLSRNKLELKEIDTILFANFADEKERNDRLVNAMFKLY